MVLVTSSHFSVSWFFTLCTPNHSLLDYCEEKTWLSPRGFVYELHLVVLRLTN